MINETMLTGLISEATIGQMLEDGRHRNLERLAAATGDQSLSDLAGLARSQPMQRAPSRARVTTPCRTTTAPTPTPIPEALATPETLKAARDAERAARHGRDRRADKVVEQLHADAELLVTKGHLPIGLVHTHLIERGGRGAAASRDRNSDAPPLGWAARAVIPTRGNGERGHHPTLAVDSQHCEGHHDQRVKYIKQMGRCTVSVEVPLQYGRDWPDTDQWVDRDGTVYAGVGPFANRPLRRLRRLINRYSCSARRSVSARLAGRGM